MTRWLDPHPVNIDSLASLPLPVGEKMIHCYPMLAPMFPEATQEMNAICSFIHKRLEV
jgi:hypothetical protein